MCPCCIFKAFFSFPYSDQPNTGTGSTSGTTRPTDGGLNDHLGNLFADLLGAAKVIVLDPNTAHFERVAYLAHQISVITRFSRRRFIIDQPLGKMAFLYYIILYLKNRSFNNWLLLLYVKNI